MRVEIDFHSQAGSRFPLRRLLKFGSYQGPGFSRAVRGIVGSRLLAAAKHKAYEKVGPTGRSWPGVAVERHREASPCSAIRGGRKSQRLSREHLASYGPAKARGPDTNQIPAWKAPLDWELRDKNKLAGTFMCFSPRPACYAARPS